ncbi:hypothetical protein ABZU76_30140 [Amycolatopsis sp. NPDC005232]|uniref:hypothetical protein n=1 Tax=Amycolatopsis sp. NPDC005232 TaxID=3157027 RepID=UPI0033A8FE41
MTGPIRGFVTFVGLAALACALTACDGSVGGNPAPAGPAASASSSAPTSQSDTPLAGMSSCKTLDQALTGQGFPPSTPSIADPEHACDTQKEGFGVFSLGLQDGEAYDTSIANPAKASAGSVRARRAILEREPTQQTGVCAVSIEVKPESRATIAVSSSRGTTDEACTKARTLASAVELLLPKNT